MAALFQCPRGASAGALSQCLLHFDEPKHCSTPLTAQAKMLKSNFSRLSSSQSNNIKMATWTESLSDYLLQVNTFLNTSPMPSILAIAGLMSSKFCQCQTFCLSSAQL